MKRYNIGDIVFVANYEYKNGTLGTNHSFVIIDDGQAVDINYFGLLLSSHIEKAKFPYNEPLKKDKVNHLREDSIVKCDDLIEITEQEIQFKIGTVAESDLERFINTFEKYIENN